MFGEFLATQIVKNNQKFVNEYDSVCTKENRYLFPNYLSPINLDYKNFPSHSPWNINTKNINVLNHTYGRRHICLPTHWVSRDIKLTNIPCYGIRLYSNNVSITNLSFCLFWIKSHIFANRIWEQRKIEIIQMIEHDHQHSSHLIKLVKGDDYQNWKFLAIKYSAMTNGNPDLHKYVRISYSKYLEHNNLYYSLSSNWNTINSANLIYGDMSEVKKIEGIVKSKLDTTIIEEYATNNLKVLKEKLNINLDDLNHTNWISTLFEYCESKLTDNNT